jgi:hypothetical protein
MLSEFARLMKEESLRQEKLFKKFKGHSWSEERHWFMYYERPDSDPIRRRQSRKLSASSLLKSE